MKLEVKKKTAAKVLGIFFLAMAVCTFLSRAAASMTVPLADIQKVKEGKLSTLLTGEGVIEAKEEKLLSLESGLRMKSVLQAGSRVQKGDTLAEYDMEYLQQVLEEKEAEIRKLELSLSQTRLQGEADASVPAAQSAGKDLDLADAALSQAQADYDQTYWDAEAQKSQAQAELDTALSHAQTALDEAYAQATALEEAEQWEEAEALWQEAQAQYDAAVQSAQAQYDSVVSQADAALSQAQENLSAQETARIQAQNAYDTAVAQDQAAAENEKRSQQENSYQQQSIQVDLKQAQKELEKLQQVKAAGGKVLAEEDAVVKSVTAAAGGITDASSSIFLGTGGYQVKGTLTAEDLSRAETGDPVKISIPGQGQAKEQTVTRILAGQTSSGEEGASAGQDTEQAGGTFYADLEEGTAVPGTQVTYEIEKQSDGSYDQILPLSAVREENGQTYCLTAEPVETVLGTEYEVKKVALTVLEKDSSNAAVKSNLSKDDQVITGSSKEIREGDKVRLAQ